jgi:hypothetical protein
MMKKAISSKRAQSQQMDKLTLKAIHVHTMALTQMHVVLLILNISQLTLIVASVEVDKHIKRANLLTLMALYTMKKILLSPTGITIQLIQRMVTG